LGVAAIAADVGIPDDFSPHALRHCFGTTLVRDGHDLVLVAELMGHARLETTRAYALPTVMRCSRPAQEAVRETDQTALTDRPPLRFR